MIKFKVHYLCKDKVIPHLCNIDSFVIRSDNVFVNIDQKGNKTGIQYIELPKRESLNLIALLKM